MYYLSRKQIYNLRPIMKNYVAMLTPSVIPIVRVAAFLLLLSTPILAQGNPTFPQPATKENPRTNPAEFNGRNENITLLERGKEEALKKQTALAQMNEDFDGIQSADREVLSAVSSELPDYKRISLGLTDIGRRANRLKKNMALPPPTKEDKKKAKRDEPDATELRPALIALNSLITSFVTNPIFKKETSVDATHLSQARRDLDGIIEFSERVRKNVEKLDKPATKPN